MANDRVPKAVLQAMGLKTQREFKALKRRQLREVLKAFDEYRRGCFYCPGSFNLGGIMDGVRRHLSRLSVKNWGR